MIIIVTKEKKIKQKEIILEDKMKKVFSVLLSLFMLWGGVLISCSAGSESSGGSAPSHPMPVITTQPEAVSWTDGDSSKALSVTAEISNDDGLVYQWYKDGEKIEGATETSYTPTEGGLYYVVVSNAKDNAKYVKSNEVRVTINPVVALEFDLFVCNSDGVKKESTDIIYDLSADFPVSAFYVKSTSYKETDFKIGDVLLYVKSGDDYIDIDCVGEPKITTKKNFNGYKIDFSNAVPNKEGDYKIEVYASPNADASKEASVSVKITVKKSSVAPESPTPVIIKQPESVQWKEGENAKTLTVEATISSGTISYQWFKDGNEIPNATATSYTPIGGGKYYVVVSNASDGTKSVRSSEVSVTIVAEEDLLPPVITANLAESASYDKVSDIKALSITATVKDGAEIYYKWYKDGNAIGEASTTASTYKPADFGSYYCELYASKGEKTSQKINSKTIKISENPIIPKASVSPTSGYIGTELTVSVTYNVAEADVTYQWVTTDKNSGNDAPIAGETSNKYTPTVAGRYYCKCIVTSKNDPTNSKPVSSSVVEVSEEVGPEIPNIESINGNTASFTETVKEGGKLELTVVASVPDGGNLSYVWYESKSASPIGTGETYSKSGVTSSDAGEYYVTVKNTLNEKEISTNSFRVTVKIDSQEPDPDPVMPVIKNINEKTSDFDLSVKEGGSFTLTVSASTTDSGTLTYEWFKQGNTTSLGTGTSYSKSNVTTSDAGKYYVKVTNTLNGKTASAESLKVTVTITSNQNGSGSGGFDFK